METCFEAVKDILSTDDKVRENAVFFAHQDAKLSITVLKYHPATMLMNALLQAGVFANALHETTQAPVTTADEMVELARMAHKLCADFRATLESKRAEKH